MRSHEGAETGAGDARLADAEASFRAAIAIRPDFPEAHNNLAAVMEMTGKYPEAVQEYQRAIELRPNYTAAKNNLNRLLARMPKNPATRP